MCGSFASFALCAVLTNCADIAATASSGAEGSRIRLAAKVQARYLSNPVTRPDDKFFLYAVNDGTGGSYMVTPTNTAFSAGDVIAVSGTDRFFATIGNHAVFPENAAMLRREKPDPPIPATPSQAVDGEFDFRIVSVSGVVVEAFHDELDPRWNWMAVHNRGRTVMLAVPGADAAAPVIDEFTGAEVSAVGLCAPPTGKRRFRGSAVRLADFNDVRILRRESSDVFSAPLLDVSAHVVSPMRRYCLDGQVLAAWGNGRVFLLPESGTAVEVRMRRTVVSPNVGDFVRVSGFASSDMFFTRLVQSVWRPAAGRAASPEAMDTSPGQVLFDESGKLRITPEFHGRLIRLTGTVAGDVSDITRRRLLPLDCGGYMVSADVSALPADVCGDMQAGSQMSVTGVCQMEFDDEGTVAGIPRLKGFSLIVRSPSDVSVLANPPLWTPLRLLAVIGALIAVMAAIMVWCISLHVVAERRGRELLREHAAHVAAELRTYERTRLAVDLHDSLAQMLTGVSLQIDAGNMPMATKSLAACRDELRNCIWDLRNHTLEESDIGEALRRTLKPHIGAAKLILRFHVPRSKVSDSTAHSVIMIVRELVANAIRHGKARTIRIAGGLDGDELRFSVWDDGCGFDPERRPGLAEGHFGLQGVRERVSRGGGTLVVESAVGRGTKVKVSLKGHT